jgi:hypothetical protein
VIIENANWKDYIARLRVLSRNKTLETLEELGAGEPARADFIRYHDKHSESLIPRCRPDHKNPCFNTFLLKTWLNARTIDLDAFARFYRPKMKVKAEPLSPLSQTTEAPLPKIEKPKPSQDAEILKLMASTLQNSHLSDTKKLLVLEALLLEE